MLFKLSALYLAATATYAVNVIQKAYNLIGKPNNAVQKLGRAITPELSQYAEALLEQYSAPGLSVGVVHLQDQTPTFEFGAWGNRTENGDQVTPESLFEIGSTGKAFLAASVGIIMDDFANHRNVTSLPPGLDSINWKTKVKDILPGEWKLLDHWASEKASLADILSHVSGLPRHDFSYEPGESLAAALKRLRYLKPTRELREEFQYNNQMYIVGSYIVSKYAGQSYPEFVRSRIFAPLNMTSSSFSGTGAEASGHLSHAFIEPYEPNTNGTSVPPKKRRIPFWFSDEDQQGLLAGAGGIISNTIDMTKWLATLLNKGVEPRTNTTVIPQAAFQHITAAHVVVPSTTPASFQPVAGYGMGWLRITDNGRELVTHGGGVPGFSTAVGFLPNEGLGFVSLINSDATPINVAIVQAMIKNVFNDQAEASTSCRSSGSATVLRDAWMHKGDTSTSRFEQGEESFGTETASLSAALSLKSYAGIYTNPGYGEFMLCTASSMITNCTEVLSNFTAVFPDAGSQSLYAAWRRIWVSHLTLTPSSSLSSDVLSHRTSPLAANKHSFALQSLNLFPEGYGKNKAPFAVLGTSPSPIPVAFVVEDGGRDSAGVKVKGLALPEGFEFPLQGVSIPDERLEEDSLVYFERLGP